MAILCCVCGTAIEPNSLNMCNTCIAAEVDIAEGIDLNAEVLQCSGCLRFQARAKGVGRSIDGAWLACDWESTELMALCLKHVHGLAKAKLIDANFIWTEPHSKRIKVKLTLQREVLNHAVIQNTCVVTYVIKNMQCPDCMKQFRNNHWRVLVQVRQKADHKRTFFRLEQLLLKHKAHEEAIGIQTAKDGVDFYFGTKGAGEKFVHFLSSRVPMRSKSASKMVSENIRQGTANMQLVFSVELSPVSKDDLVWLPPKTAQSCSSISRLALCARTTSLLHFVDPLTGRRGELNADKFWKLPFLPLETSQNMVEFVVLDVEPVHAAHGSKPSAQQGTDAHMVLADIEVARASDFGVNDTTFVVRSHLGGLLEAGDSVKGYDLSSANFGTRYTYSMPDELPDVLLVRKVYPREQKDRKAEKKKLKKLATSDRGVKMSKAEAARQEREFEQFEEEFLEEEEFGEHDDDDFVESEFVPLDGDDDDDEAPPASDDEGEDEEKPVAAALGELSLSS